MQEFTEKEILGDGLSTQKSATEKFNTYANECVHDNLRNAMMNILQQEHGISTEIFNMTHQRGLYETPLEERKKIMLMGLEGKSGEEIACDLNITIHTVKQQKYRAYKFLREQLGQYTSLLFIFFYR